MEYELASLAPTLADPDAEPLGLGPELASLAPTLGNTPESAADLSPDFSAAPDADDARD